MYLGDGGLSSFSCGSMYAGSQSAAQEQYLQGEVAVVPANMCLGSKAAVLSWVLLEGIATSTESWPSLMFTCLLHVCFWC